MSWRPRRPIGRTRIRPMTVALPVTKAPNGPVKTRSAPRTIAQPSHRIA
jgi:hypothetical protein